VGSALDVVKKKSHFKVHDKANEAYVEQCKLVKQAKALARGQDLPRSLPRGTRKPLPQLANLNPTCKLYTRRTLRRPKKLQRKPRSKQN
jgi:hypothetical protein